MSAYARGGDLYHTKAQSQAPAAYDGETMKLVHLTKYWGDNIGSRRGDREVDFSCLWCQALVSCSDRRICRSFGTRAVEITETILEGVHNNKWNLWKVSKTLGRKGDGHCFWKFLLVPQGVYGMGKGTLQAKGWTLETDYGIDISKENLLTELTEIIAGYWNDRSNRVNHVHIGLFLNGHDIMCNDKVHVKTFINL